MEPKSIYSTKAEKYARYRWDYVSQAVEAMFEIAALTTASIVVDIGAGSGILTRHLVGRVNRVIALEPGVEFRRLLKSSCSRCLIAAAYAEELPLANRSMDLIAVAQAIHWFQPEPTRAEFRRVLKPGGWLALFRNYPTNADRNRDMARLYREEYGVNMSMTDSVFHPKPVSDYFAGSFQTLTFPFSFRQDWDAFLGVMLSTAAMPAEDHPFYPRLEAAAREIFDRYSEAGTIAVHGETELILGKVDG